MHPPRFDLAHRLSDWPECRVEARCPACRHVAYLPTAFIRSASGDLAFREVLAKLRCGRCGAVPAPVFLLAGQHRIFCNGGPADWAIELVGIRRIGRGA